MIRTFHSIGQGAFYTEEFDDFRFIYDCGTDTDGKERIEKYIKNHFKKTISLMLYSYRIFTEIILMD